MLHLVHFLSNAFLTCRANIMNRPGTLPEGGRNVPQKCAFDLYSEQLNGTSFISSRQTLQHV
jgi:homogentisate 1,2-dioxygenase